jgi:hypothetical protein
MLFKNTTGAVQRLQSGNVDKVSGLPDFFKNHLKTVSRTFFKERKINYAE